MRRLREIVRRAAPLLTVAAALAAGVGGCDSATTLMVTVDVRDNSVPHFTELGIEISGVADPSRTLSQMFITTASGYGAEGGLPAVVIPQQDSFTIDPSYLSGEVLVTAQGIDIASGAVLARGSAMAVVVAKQQTAVTVTLHGLGAGCGTDGGDGGVVDAAGACDAGAGGG